MSVALSAEWITPHNYFEDAHTAEGAALFRPTVLQHNEEV